MNKIILFFFTFAVGIMFSTKTQAQPDKYYYFEQGRENLINGKFHQAINDYNVLLNADTSLYDAHFYRGIAKYNLNDYLGALSDFNRAVFLNPNFTQAYHYRAITNSQLNRFDAATTDFNKALLLRPDYAGVYFSRGISYLMSQQLDKSIADFNRFLRSEPNASDAYVNRGTAYLLKSDTTNAIKDYNKALILNAFDPNAYARRARIYALQNKPDLALKDLNEAIRLDSTSSLIYFNRALIYYNQKKISNALADLDRVLQLDPNNALTYYNRALIRSQIGDYNRAIDDYGKVIDINPSNVLAHFNRAAVQIELKNYQQALRDYTKAIDLYPDFANAYLNRSFVKTQLGQAASANQDYNIAQQKIKKYRSQMNDSTFSVFADTSKQFNKLLALEADFTKKTFNNELQNRKSDIVLSSQFKFTPEANKTHLSLSKQYFNPPLDQFLAQNDLSNVVLSNQEVKLTEAQSDDLDARAQRLLTDSDKKQQALGYFIRGMNQAQQKQFASAINYFNQAINLDPNFYYYLNRSATQSAMIEFISSIESNIPSLTLDNSGGYKTKNFNEAKTYSFQEAIDDLNTMEKMQPDFAYIYFNRGNLKSLSNRTPEAIEDYSKAIDKYPYFGEAYYNRGLLQIYLRDTEKGCLDISKAGELGIEAAYSTIKKFCVKE